MKTFQFMTANDLAARMGEADLRIMDIRDNGSFTEAHINGAEPLGDNNLKAFIDEADKQSPVVVCCYHGNSSQNAAAYLAAEGFQEVYSLNGGFEMWRTLFPEHVDR